MEASDILTGAGWPLTHPNLASGEACSRGRGTHFFCCLNTEGGVNQHSWLESGPLGDLFPFEHGDIAAMLVYQRVERVN